MDGMKHYISLDLELSVKAAVTHLAERRTGHPDTWAPAETECEVEVTAASVNGKELPPWLRLKELYEWLAQFVRQEDLDLTEES